MKVVSLFAAFALCAAQRDPPVFALSMAGAVKQMDKVMSDVRQNWAAFFGGNYIRPAEVPRRPGRPSNQSTNLRPSTASSPAQQPQRPAGSAQQPQTPNSSGSDSAQQPQGPAESESNLQSQSQGPSESESNLQSQSQGPSESDSDSEQQPQKPLDADSGVATIASADSEGSGSGNEELVDGVTPGGFVDVDLAD